MGRKCEAYQKAVQANDMAGSREIQTRGGSTQSARLEAVTNKEQTQRTENEAWKNFIDDPEG